MAGTGHRARLRAGTPTSPAMTQNMWLYSRFEPALDPIVAGVMQRKQRIVERHAGVRGDRRAGEVAKRRKLGDRGHVIVDAMIARCRASR